MDYSRLKPGVHFYQGEKHLKSLPLTDAGPWYEMGILGGGRTQGPETLFAKVSWKHIALTHRRGMMSQIPVEWERNGEEVEQPPIKFDVMREMPRIDQAIELLGAAYLFKLRGGRGVVELRWLDPAAVEPDEMSLTPEGYQRYRYSTDRGVRYLPAEDIIRIYNAGMREHDPEPPASSASSLAAQLLLGMEETADTFYDTNGLPVIAVIVPDNTIQTEVERTENRFRRIFQSKRSLEGNKTIGLRQGTDIKTISFKPSELAMPELSDEKIDAILLSHGVPPALARRDVNRAEAELKMLQFVDTISGRMEMIANAINTDEDIARFGVELVVHKERHEIVQQWELMKAESLQRLVGRPVLTINEARERLELEPIVGGDDILAGFNEQVEDTGGLEDDAELDAGVERAKELGKLRAFIKAGKHEKRDFHSDILTPWEIRAIMLEEGAISGDTPFGMNTKASKHPSSWAMRKSTLNLGNTTNS